MLQNIKNERKMRELSSCSAAKRAAHISKVIALRTKKSRLHRKYHAETVAVRLVRVLYFFSLSLIYFYAHIQTHIEPL